VTHLKNLDENLDRQLHALHAMMLPATPERRKGEYDVDLLLGLAKLDDATASWRLPRCSLTGSSALSLAIGLASSGSVSL
jgi:hypothetical protein